MGNKAYALEWLDVSNRHLQAARILIEADHYTDVIGLELHQAIEKALKAIPAYYNIKIDRTHDLSKLMDQSKTILQIKEHWIDLCDIATEYYQENRYPGPSYVFPSGSEIQEVYNMAQEIYDQILRLLGIVS